MVVKSLCYIQNEDKKQIEKREHQKLILKEWDNLNNAEKDRVLYLDEKLCVRGSLAHDKKLQKAREDYFKSIALKGGVVAR